MKSLPTRLSLKDYTVPGKKGHFARMLMSYDSKTEVHSQNFCEVFWIEKGEGWHFINNNKIELKSGCLCFIRAKDIHGFSSKLGMRMTMANIAFSPETQKNISIRHAQIKSFFDESKLLPTMMTLDEDKLLELSRFSQFLGEGPLPAFHVEWFLLSLLILLYPHESSDEYQDLPEWLKFACQKIKIHRAFHDGTVALVKFAGRSPEHVSRTLRKLRGVTPTEIVNQARVRHCANALVTTEDKIAQIALEAGFQNLGHFYQIFRNTYHTSPRQYRLRQRSIFRGKGK